MHFSVTVDRDSEHGRIELRGFLGRHPCVNASFEIAETRNRHVLLWFDGESRRSLAAGRARVQRARDVVTVEDTVLGVCVPEARRASELRFSAGASFGVDAPRVHIAPDTALEVVSRVPRPRGEGLEQVVLRGPPPWWRRYAILPVAIATLPITLPLVGLLAGLAARRIGRGVQ